MSEKYTQFFWVSRFFKIDNSIKYFTHCKIQCVGHVDEGRVHPWIAFGCACGGAVSLGVGGCLPLGHQGTLYALAHAGA